jgi:cytochrome c5
MSLRAPAWLFVACLVALAGSVSARPQSQISRDDKKVELPEGEGKKILETACTTCHGLEEVTKFKGYNTKDEWRDVVVTMVMYGAELKPPEIEILVDYLGKNFSKPQ